jgi:NAD-dependent SIR2 family protein deacetylase
MDFLRQKFEEQITASVDEEKNLITIGDEGFTSNFTPARILKEVEETTYRAAFTDWKSRYFTSQLSKAEEILNKHDNRRRFLRLEEILQKSGSVIPFIGAGMSCESGFESWTGYLWNLQRYSEVTSEELQALLDDGQYDAAAEVLLNSLGENLFDERLQTTYSIFEHSIIRGAVNYLPLIFSKSLITTNFDDVLERVYQEAENPFSEVLLGRLGISFNRHVSEGKLCLLKIHGKYSEPASRVLTKTEYDDSYENNHKLKDTLKLAFKSNTFLFLGCSLNQDRTMQLMKSFVDEDKNNIPTHFAFLPEPSLDEKRRERERFLAERKIFPIWYQDGEHEESIEALFIKILSDNNAL